MAETDKDLLGFVELEMMHKGKSRCHQKDYL